MPFHTMAARIGVTCLTTGNRTLRHLALNAVTAMGAVSTGVGASVTNSWNRTGLHMASSQSSSGISWMWTSPIQSAFSHTQTCSFSSTSVRPRRNLAGDWLESDGGSESESIADPGIANAPHAPEAVAPTPSVSVTVGSLAPLFTTSGVLNGELKSAVSLEDFRGKYVVLLFYPSDFTFVCPTELLSFSKQYEQFQRLNCEVLAVSVDSQFAHFAWEHMALQKGGIGPLPFPLLSDPNRAISSAYNVLLPEQGLDVRATFLLDECGVVRSVMMNDLQVGRSVKEILRLVQAFQYSHQHGKVMPCDWQPGDEAIKAEPQAAMNYFKQHNDKSRGSTVAHIEQQAASSAGLHTHVQRHMHANARSVEQAQNVPLPLVSEDAAVLQDTNGQN